MYIINPLDKRNKIQKNKEKRNRATKKKIERSIIIFIYVVHYVSTIESYIIYKQFVFFMNHVKEGSENGCSFGIITNSKGLTFKRKRAQQNHH